MLQPVFVGIGIGMTFPLLISLLAHSVEPQEQGLAVGREIDCESIIFVDGTSFVWDPSPNESD